MKRILLMLAVAAMMTAAALPGTAFAQPKGSGGHFEDLPYIPDTTITGGGAHISGNFLGDRPINGGFGGGNEHGSGGGGGCITDPTGERECGRF